MADQVLPAAPKRAPWEEWRRLPGMRENSVGVAHAWLVSVLDGYAAAPPSQMLDVLLGPHLGHTHEGVMYHVLFAGNGVLEVAAFDLDVSRLVLG